jgi:hypothetical protein
MSPNARSILNLQAAQPISRQLGASASLAHKLLRLNQVAVREPTAVLGTLQFWLGAQSDESEPRGDC